MKRFKDYDSKVQELALTLVAEMSHYEKACSALDFLRERCPQNIQDAFQEWNLDWAAAEAQAAIEGDEDEDVQ